MQLHPHGLVHDLATLDRLARSRRQALRWLGAGAALPIVGCGGGGGDATSAATEDLLRVGGGTAGARGGATGSTSTGTSSSTSTSTSTTTSTTTSGSSSCSQIPSETAGPYPGDGTNNGTNGGIANALTQSGIVRSNIVSSFGSSSGTATGIPLTITLNVVNVAKSCASLAGFAVYLWHCDALGRYSMYTAAIAGQNYLRGVQVTDSAGSVTFTSIFPGCYDGRWPHIHFEVFSSLASATSGNNDIKTSQIALAPAACSAVYASSIYTGSAANFAKSSLASDNVFSDGYALELATVTGSNAAGYAATLTVGVSV
ncbi:MAG TPA: intradiol ring-cleavage dioxygenase [Burkholderiaceae bacterium]|nr:intradiol ring-cleavage dioxygenase [Burkholderiaceae bacterium]